MQQHIPLRDNKLTHLMSHALGGNSLTSIICHVSPNKEHLEASLATLRFAILAKRIKLHALQNEIVGGFEHINEDMERLSRLDAAP